MPTPHHGNWTNVDEDPDETIAGWYPECAFDDPDDRRLRDPLDPE